MKEKIKNECQNVKKERALERTLVLKPFDAWVKVYNQENMAILHNVNNWNETEWKHIERSFNRFTYIYSKHSNRSCGMHVHDNISEKAEKANI